MPPDVATNGGSAAAFHDLTPAQKLQEKHKASEVHGATIEDVVDEEDLTHPPPSLHTAPATASTPVLLPAEVPISETAAGKQKAREAPNGFPSASKKETNPTLDTQSEELFPALGGAPKPQAPAPLAKAWGTKKSNSIRQVHSNGTDGTNGNETLSTSASSRASTPASGIWTPTANAGAPPQSRASPSSRLPIPGKYTERIQFAPSQLLPRNQLKNPIRDVLRNINKRSKAKVEMKPGANGALVFEATGPLESVRQALMETSKEIGSKQSVKIPIPISVRPHIIGRQGAVVNGISKRTGAYIQVPKAEEISMPNVEDDDSMTIDVVVEGNAVAAELARVEIERIVNDRTTTVNMRLRDIPPEFFPFIAGPNNSGISTLESGRQLKVEIPHYYTWSHQPPPQAPSSGMVPQFVPDVNSHIRISGDRQAAQEARSEIERHVEQLRRQITLSQLAINRGQHQFILGDNGELLHDLLKETGCAVILPPASDDTEFLSVTGPYDKIEVGVEKVMNLATIMQMSSVDIARQHANAAVGAQVHARALTRYLQQRQAIEQLERQYDARIVLPTTLEGPMNWEVYSRDGKNTIRARSDIMNLINAYPPARIRHVKADSFFHQYLQQQCAQVVRNDFGVHLLLPDEVDQTPEIILVCEGHELRHADVFHLPKQRPSATEIAEFEDILDKAQAHILSLIHDQDEIGAASVEVPAKFYDKVRKFVNLQQQDLPPTKIPVQMIFGPVSPLENSTGSSQPPTASSELGHQATLRGPCTAVEELAEKLVAFVEDQKQNELERGHVTTFDFPHKYANFLIGKKGENINKYREEFDVDIQIKDGKVEIKGPKENADLAKSKITSLGKKLEDEATYVLKIKPQYHRELIGSKGSQVNRLQNRYDVRVQFPRNAQAGSDDRSVADGASDVGGSRNGRTNQSPDEVIIRGPKKGADAAREEILNLLQWVMDNSHSSTVSVAQSQLPSLIGQGGREMDAVREKTNAQIDVPGNRDSADSSGRAQIQIRGTKKQVEDAKQLLEEKAKLYDENITKSIDVDKKYHSALIGVRGSKIRSIILEAGGHDVGRDLGRTVRFPPQNSPDKTIRIEGKGAVVEKIIAAIQSFTDQRHDQTNEIIEVLPGKHRLLIGPGGETRRNLESQFKVSIDIPKLSQQGPARSQVKIAGQPKDIEQAKAHILDLVKDEDGETVQVPRRIHHTISENGQFFRRLRHDHNVRVDHGGQIPPPRPRPASRSRANGVEALPLITDNQDSAGNHSWEIVDFDGGENEEGVIPWILRGSPESVPKARALLETAIGQWQAEQRLLTGYLVLPDPRKYRYIVGQGGSQIHSIREQTGCKITVPRDQTRGGAIEIVGSREGVEHAKKIILEVVQNSGNGGNGSRRT